MTKTYPPLTAYRVFLSNGTNYVTSMAAGVTLEDAKRYFLGETITQMVGNSEKHLTVVDVETA